MSISYNNLKKHPRNFRDIIGLKVGEFEKTVEKVKPEWKKREDGRKSHIKTLEDNAY